MKRTLTFAFTFVLILTCARAAYSEVSLDLPTGGYFRSGQIMPAVLVVETLGNSVNYSLTVSPSRPSGDYRTHNIIVENIEVAPRTVYRMPFGFMIDARRPGAEITVYDEFTRTREQVYAEDLSPRLRYLNDSDRLFVVLGDAKSSTAVSERLSLPEHTVRAALVRPSSCILDRRIFLDGIDCLVITSADAEPLEKGKLRNLLYFAEMGGVVVIADKTRCNEILSFAFPTASGWDGTGDIPDTLKPLAHVPKHCAILGYGLGKLVVMSVDPADKQSWDSAWQSVVKEVEFIVSPTSMFAPAPDVRFIEPNITPMFKDMEIAPAYRRLLLSAIVGIFLSFIVIVSVLSAFKVGKNPFIVFLAIGITAIVVATLINSYVPKPGVIVRHRTVVETNGNGKGRMTVFTSFAASSEQKVTFSEPLHGLTKILYGQSDMLPPTVPRTRYPNTNWVLRGIPVTPRRQTILMTSFPLSSIPPGALQFAGAGIVMASAEITSREGTVYRRKHMAFDDSSVELGLDSFERSKLAHLTPPIDGVGNDEWSLLRLAALGRISKGQHANVYWPIPEPASMTGRLEIRTIEFDVVEEQGAVIVFAPVSEKE